MRKNWVFNETFSDLHFWILAEVLLTLFYCFHMLVTYLCGKVEKMPVSEEIYKWSDLVKPFENVKGAGVADIKVFEFMESMYQRIKGIRCNSFWKDLSWRDKHDYRWREFIDRTHWVGMSILTRILRKRYSQ